MGGRPTVGKRSMSPLSSDLSTLFALYGFADCSADRAVPLKGDTGGAVGFAQVAPRRTDPSLRHGAVWPGVLTTPPPPGVVRRGPDLGGAVAAQSPDSLSRFIFKLPVVVFDLCQLSYPFGLQLVYGALFFECLAVLGR